MNIDLFGLCGVKTIKTFFTLVLYKLFISIYNCHQYQEAFNSPQK